MDRRRVSLANRCGNNSDKGYTNTTLLGKPSVQIPSNITRLARAFRKRCVRGIPQVTYYQAGVGTGPSMSDHLLGGGFGVGVAQVSPSFKGASRRVAREVFTP